MLNKFIICAFVSLLSFDILILYGILFKNPLRRNYAPSKSLINDKVVSYFAAPKLLKSSKKGVLSVINAYVLECGDICNLSLTPPSLRHENSGSLSYPAYAWKRFKCERLMERFDDTVETKKLKYPPKGMPPILFYHYTMYGRSNIYPYYMDNSNSKENGSSNITGKIITQEAVNKLIKAKKKNFLESSYGPIVVNMMENIFVRYANNGINRGIGMDFGGGSSLWVTVLALLHGAKLMYILDYNSLPSTHPQIKTFTPKQFARMMFIQSEINLANGTEKQKLGGLLHEPFDFVISYSSLEHSGLGRYGDKLNPYGDLEAAAQIWCLLKPGGLLILNVPYNSSTGSVSSVYWNAHRIYGRDRVLHLLANFEVLETLETCNPVTIACPYTSLSATVLVLKKISPKRRTANNVQI